MLNASKVGAAAIALGLAVVSDVTSNGQTRSAPAPDWTSVDRETLEHYQALLRFDTSDPPGNERIRL